jgi:glycerophosphoryl diester phosphodiesterase
MSFVLAGHRGAMAVAPENTIGSFRRAIADGANEIEFDIRASADGIAVVMHDAEVDRTTSGTGPVAELTFAEIRALDAGGGAVVPTLDEVLDELSETAGVSLQIEVKAAEVIGALGTAVRSRPALPERITVTSFHADLLEQVAKELPDIALGLISGTATEDTLEQAVELDAARALVGWTGLDQGYVNRAHAGGLALCVWPVATAEQLRAGIELGVDGITTNDPAFVRGAGFGLRDGALVELDS